MEGHQFFKWVSFKELLFVFVACGVVAVLIRTQDTLEFKPVWNITLNKAQSNENSREKIPLPIVTDLESDGHSDIILVTPDKLLHIYSRVHSPAYLGHHGVNHTSRNISLSKTARVVAMTTGFLEPYQSMVQVRKQVIAILYNDWTVSCYSNKLKELWSKKLTDKDTTIMGEASILISSFSVKGTSSTGTIIVGGRVREGNNDPPAAAHDSSYQRHIRRGADQEVEEQHRLESLGHYCTYAVDGRTRELLWKHEPGDFIVHPAYDDGISSFLHFKLLFHKYMSHQGEVSWHQYSTAITKVMPHYWYDESDTRMQLAHFKKDRKKTDEPAVSEHLSNVGGLAMDHIAGYAFGGLRPHTPDEHVHNPNVLAIHSMKGIEVLHFNTGRPLFTLPLSPTHAVHGDINDDGIIEHVHAVVNPGDDYKPGDVVSKHEDMNCYGQAISLNFNAKKVFKHSICKATHWTESFVAIDQWFPKLSQYHRKKVNHGSTEPFHPILIRSPSHQHPLKVSSLTRNSSFKLPVGVVYDSVFLLSSGRVTSIGPRGQFNWQVDTNSDWDELTDSLYSSQDAETKPYHQLQFSFTPTLLAFSLKPYAPKTHILLVGWSTVSVLDAIDGTNLVEYGLSSPPIMRAVVADFTDDGVNDIILVTSDRIIGLSLMHQSGFIHTTILSLFVGFVIILVAVYTRQRTGFLMPRAKIAQD